MNKVSLFDFAVISKSNNKYQESPEGDLIDDILQDSKFPVDGTTEEISSYLDKNSACSQALEALDSLLKDYHSSSYTSKDLPKEIPQNMRKLLGIEGFNSMTLEEFNCYGKTAFPYGKYIVSNGGEYLFDRGYETLLYKNSQTGVVQICKGDFLDGFKKETVHFYDSSCAPYKSGYTHYKIARIHKRWDEQRVLARNKQPLPLNQGQQQQSNEIPI